MRPLDGSVLSGVSGSAKTVSQRLPPPVTREMKSLPWMYAQTPIPIIITSKIPRIVRTVRRALCFFFGLFFSASFLARFAAFFRSFLLRSASSFSGGKPMRSVGSESWTLLRKSRTASSCSGVTEVTVVSCSMIASALGF